MKTLWRRNLPIKLTIKMPFEGPQNIPIKFFTPCLPMSLRNLPMSRFALFALVALVLGGCGNDRVKVKPGPFISRLVEEKDYVDELLDKKAQVKKILGAEHELDALVADKKEENINNDRRAKALATLDQCGLDEASTSGNSGDGIPDDTHFMNLAAQTSPIIEMKSLSMDASNYDHSPRTNLLPVVASSIVTAQSLKHASVKEISQGYHPITIYSRCFFLPEGETIETNGRDFIVVADRAVIRGTIDTSPKVLEQSQPHRVMSRHMKGKQGGRIDISALKFDLGSSHKFITSGGSILTPRTQSLSESIVVGSPEYENFTKQNFVSRYIKTKTFDAHENTSLPVNSETTTEYFARAHASIRHRFAGGAIVEAALFEAKVESTPYYVRKDSPENYGQGIPELYVQLREAGSNGQHVKNLLENNFATWLKPWKQVARHYERKTPQNIFTLESLHAHVTYEAAMVSEVDYYAGDAAPHSLSTATRQQSVTLHEPVYKLRHLFKVQGGEPGDIILAGGFGLSTDISAQQNPGRVFEESSTESESDRAPFEGPITHTKLGTMEESLGPLFVDAHGNELNDHKVVLPLKARTFPEVTITVKNTGLYDTIHKSTPPPFKVQLRQFTQERTIGEIIIVRSSVSKDIGSFEEAKNPSRKEPKVVMSADAALKHLKANGLESLPFHSINLIQDLAP